VYAFLICSQSHLFDDVFLQLRKRQGRGAAELRLGFGAVEEADDVADVHVIQTLTFARRLVRRRRAHAVDACLKLFGEVLEHAAHGRHRRAQRLRFVS
jgi:hypothetical protein